MKNLKTIFSFETTQMLKKKSILISTALIALVLFAVTFIPRFIPTGSEENPDNGQTSSYVELTDTLFISENPEVLETMRLLFSEFEAVHFTDSESEGIRGVEDETYDRAFIIHDELSYEMVVYDQSKIDGQYVFEAVYGEYLVTQRLNEKGIDIEAVYEAQNVQFQSEVQLLGKDSFQGFFFAFSMLFALYMLIILYGQNVATSVAREKDSRTMELLITSTKPKALIIGKVLAAGLVGILQILSVLVALVVGYFINRGTYSEVILYFIESSVQWDVVLIYAIFSIMGYLLYLFIYAALGSLVSKVEDVGSAVTPITFIFVAAYMIASFGMSTPDSLIVRVSSYIPFVSLFTTPIRYMMTNVSTFELVTSISLMLVATLLIMQLSVVIYRQGSLNYGNKMSLTKVMRGLVKKNNNVN